jgi:hypothetical protein
MKKMKTKSFKTGSHSDLLCYASQITFQPLALPKEALIYSIGSSPTKLINISR